MAPPRRSAHAAKLDSLGDVAVRTEMALARRGRWAEAFRERIGPSFDGRITFEVGCFDAAFLCGVAAEHPRTAFIGLDWKCKAVCDGAEHVARQGLNNVLLLHGRAQDLPALFAASELSEIWVLHPDPCDKPKELPNRLLAPPFLAAAHEALAPQGHVVVKTDHPGYYQWLLALLGLPEPEWFDVSKRTPASPKLRVADLVRRRDLPAASGAVTSQFEVAANSPDYWADPAIRASAEPRAFAGMRTHFERRYLAKRLPIYYLELRRRG